MTKRTKTTGTELQRTSGKLFSTDSHRWYMWYQYYATNSMHIYVCVWIICVWYVFVSTILYIINYMSCMHKSEQFPCGPCLIIWVAWMLGLCMDHPAGHVEGQWSHVAYQIWQWNRAWEHQTPLHTFTLFSMSSVKLSEQYRTPTG